MHLPYYCNNQPRPKQPYYNTSLEYVCDIIPPRTSPLLCQTAHVYKERCCFDFDAPSLGLGQKTIVRGLLLFVMGGRMPAAGCAYCSWWLVVLCIVGFVGELPIATMVTINYCKWPSFCYRASIQQHPPPAQPINQPVTTKNVCMSAKVMSIQAINV